MPILTKPMKEYVLSKDKKGWNKSAYNSRIQQYAIQGLKDLTLLANQLPEGQLAEIFNEKTLHDLFKAMLKIKTSAKNHEKWKKLKETSIILKKRKRLLKICYMILMLVGDFNFVATLVPSNWKPWLRGGYPPIDNLRAILYVHQI
ncbi:MAG: hypothetical protein E3J73_04310 [Candidatus Bathyarchaeum sp.]|nr:MAG: hypothetical protein E3J73_04310 [Candidatus Bathyarchaeum sp.]